MNEFLYFNILFFYSKRREDIMKVNILDSKIFICLKSFVVRCVNFLMRDKVYFIVCWELGRKCVF